MRIRRVTHRVLTSALFLSAVLPAIAQPTPYAAEPFLLGPAPPTVDLRNMLRGHIVRRSCELLDAAVYQSLATVTGLRRHRSDAKESKPVCPVPERAITAIFGHVSRQVRAMMELQLFTAARPGELVIMRATDIDMTGKV